MAANNENPYVDNDLLDNLKSFTPPENRKFENDHSIKKADESKMSDEIAKYLKIGEKAKNDLDALYKSTNSKSFKLSTSVESKYNLQNKAFNLTTSVFHSSATKETYHPMIWFTETLCPGSPKVVYESWFNPSHRLKWDEFSSQSEKIILDEQFSNLFILKSATHPAAGGIISARDFVGLCRIYTELDGGKIQIASTSIERKDMPKTKGHVRGNIILSGVLFEKMEAKEMAKCKLPKLMLIDDEKETECQWTRIRYIVQTDLKGWIHSSVINSAMSSTNVGMMKSLRDYVIEKRLKLKK